MRGATGAWLHATDFSLNFARGKPFHSLDRGQGALRAVAVPGGVPRVVVPDALAAGGFERQGF